MKIDVKAPLKAKTDIVIDAPVETVWKIQTDIKSWPNWQKEVSYVELRGKLAKGTVFNWKVMGMQITSELQEVSKYKTIGWSGKSIGMKAIHIWNFEKHGNKTRVITEESLSGGLPLIIKMFKPDFLEQSLSKALQTLKHKTEKTK